MTDLILDPGSWSARTEEPYAHFLSMKSGVLLDDINQLIFIRDDDQAAVREYPLTHYLEGEK